MPAKKIFSKLTAIIVISLSISACTHHEKRGTASSTAWPFYQGDLIHQGYIKGDTAPNFSKKWIKPLEESTAPPYASQETSSPAANNGRIFCGSVRGKGLQALNYKTGDIFWSFKLAKGMEGGPALFEDMLYLGSNDGYIYAINADTGKLLWSFNAEAEILSSPVAAEGILFFTSSINQTYALDAKTGKLLWKHSKYGGNNYSIRGAASPAYSGGILYVGLSDGTVVALGAFDGSILWEKEISKTRGLKFYDIDSSPTVDNKTVYIASYNAGLFALNATNGDVIWKYDANGSSSPAYDDQALYFPDSRGKVIAIEKGSGKLLWEYVLKEGTATSPIAVGDYLVFGSSHKRLYLMNKRTGEVLDTFRAASGFSSAPIFYRGIVYAVSNAGYLYALGR